MGNIDTAAQTWLRVDEVPHLLRIPGLGLEVGLEHEPLRDERHYTVEREIEPVSINLHDNFERPQIPADLLRDLRLLDLDGDLATIGQPSPVDLRNACTRPRLSLHQPLALLTGKTNAKNLLGPLTPEVAADDLLDVVPAGLRRIVELSTSGVSYFHF